MILNPPGWFSGAAQQLPHWPYLQAVDAALTARGIPPDTVRAHCTPAEQRRTMYLLLAWDISRTADMGGLRFTWDEETGWSYARLGAAPPIATRPRPIAVLHRVFAAPDDVAEVAEQYVGTGHTSAGEHGAEWAGASLVRYMIERLRSALDEPGGIWTGG